MGLIANLSRHFINRHRCLIIPVDVTLTLPHPLSFLSFIHTSFVSIFLKKLFKHLFLFKWNFYVSPNYVFQRMLSSNLSQDRQDIDQILWNLIPIEYISPFQLILLINSPCIDYFYRSYTFLLDKVDRHQMDHKNQFLPLKINLLNRAYILLLRFFITTYFAYQL